MSDEPANAPRRKLSILVPSLPWEKDDDDTILFGGAEFHHKPGWPERPNRMNDSRPQASSTEGDSLRDSTNGPQNGSQSVGCTCIAQLSEGCACNASEETREAERE